jgi:purine-binding chemotaxis protein CheW
MAPEFRTQTTEEQVVVFSLADELYGLDISRVQGIIKMPEVTRVPRAAEFVEGVINLRGEIVPIIDLRKRFGLAHHKDSVDTRIINVEMGDHLVGLIVDAVEEVLNIPSDVIEPPPDLVTTVDSAYLRSIAKLQDRLVILLDLDRVLSTAEQQAIGRMTLETA